MEDKPNKHPGLFMKLVLISMFLFLIVFTITILYLFSKTSTEPSALITAVFAFCGLEGGAMAWIKTIKNNNKNNEEE